MIGVAVVSGKGRALLDIFRDRRRLAGLTASAIAISANWVCFIWAVGNGHALDASVGYFIFPLFAVLIGAVVFKERLGPRQIGAIALVCLGVGVLASGTESLPWLVLSFPLTFGLYSLLRKIVPVEAMVGLAVETAMVAPLALAYLAVRPEGGAILLADGLTRSLLIAAGPVTAIPLVLFAFGARRLPLSTVGLLQYLSPTIQMAIAVLAFGESFTPAHGVTFALIWSGLALYSLPRRRARAG